jgi:hypothetical protein
MNRFLLFLSFFLECYTESYCVYIGSFCIDSSIFSYTWGGWGGGPSHRMYMCVVVVAARRGLQKHYGYY